MQNKKLTILIILGATAVFSLLYGIISTPKGRKKLTPKESAIYRDARTEPEKMISPMKRHAKKTKFTKWARDPFLLKGTASSASGLTGIIWDEKSPKALIDDDIVGIGDKWGGNTVIDIKQDRVILNDGTKDFELRLQP